MDQIYEGSLCAARYKEDYAWYRAKIVEVISKEEVLVYYVDYGNSDKVSYDWLMPVAEEFHNIPAQAVKCCLASFDADAYKPDENKIINTRFLQLMNVTLTVVFNEPWPESSPFSTGLIYPAHLINKSTKRHVHDELLSP